MSSARALSLPEPNLVRQWREEAILLRRRSATAQADVLESCADELETFTQRQDQEPLTLRQAAERSGYSADHLRRLVRHGELQARREGRRLRFRAADLPQKPKAFDGRLSPEYDPFADARQVIARRSRGELHETQTIAVSEGQCAD